MHTLKVLVHFNYNLAVVHSKSQSVRICHSNGLVPTRLESQYKDSIGIPMLKIRWSWEGLALNVWIPIPGKDSLYIEQGLSSLFISPCALTLSSLRVTTLLTRADFCWWLIKKHQTEFLEILAFGTEVWMLIDSPLSDGLQSTGGQSNQHARDSERVRRMLLVNPTSAAPLQTLTQSQIQTRLRQRKFNENRYRYHIWFTYVS